MDKLFLRIIEGQLKVCSENISFDDEVYMTMYDNSLRKFIFEKIIQLTDKMRVGEKDYEPLEAYLFKAADGSRYHNYFPGYGPSIPFKIVGELDMKQSSVEAKALLMRDLFNSVPTMITSFDLGDRQIDKDSVEVISGSIYIDTEEQ